MIPAAIRIVVAIAVLAAFAAAGHVTPALQTALWNGARPPLGTFGAETYFAAGEPRVPAGWFGDAALSRVLPAVGIGGLDVLGALAVTLALGLTERRARLRGGPLASALSVLLAFACAASAFELGDRFATDGLLAALALAALDRGDRRRYALVALAFVWAWLTPDALLAALFAAAVAIGTTFEARMKRDVTTRAPRDAWTLVLLTLLATLATPAGLRYPLASLSALGIDGKTSPYSIYPGDLAPLAYHGGFTALLFVALALGGAYGPAAFASARAALGERDAAALAGASGPGDGASLALAVLLGFANGALLPIAGILAAPILAGAAARRFGRFERAVASARVRVLPLAIVAVGLLALLVPIVGERRAGPKRADATALAAAIANDPSAHALFCFQPLWCAGALGSHVRVGLYGRAGWPDAAVDDQTTVATVGPHWYRVVEAHRIDRILAARTLVLAGLLRLHPEWHEIGDDGRAVAFARTLAPERAK